MNHDFFMFSTWTSDPKVPSADPGFLDESCLYLWCIYGHEIFMDTTTDLNRYHISMIWMDESCLFRMKQGAFHGFPKICSQDCVFSVWGQWSACENQVRKREQREALPLFFTFQRGRAWQYMAIILIVLPYIYINIYGIWSVYIYNGCIIHHGNIWI